MMIISKASTSSKIIGRTNLTIYLANKTVFVKIRTTAVPRIVLKTKTITVPRLVLKIRTIIVQRIALREINK